MENIVKEEIKEETIDKIMENIVKEDIKEETIDIGTEFLPVSSCTDGDTISR